MSNYWELLRFESGGKWKPGKAFWPAMSFDVGKVVAVISDWAKWILGATAVVVVVAVVDFALDSVGEVWHSMPDF